MRLFFFMFVRSSRPDLFCKKGILKNFAKFTGKHLCLRPATLLKKRLWRRCFPVNFVKYQRTPFLIEHLWWLLLVCAQLLNDYNVSKNKFLLNKLYVKKDFAGNVQYPFFFLEKSTGLVEQQIKFEWPYIPCLLPCRSGIKKYWPNPRGLCMKHERYFKTRLT